jgi:chloramphenicol O-acetyltransferase type B
VDSLPSDEEIQAERVKILHRQIEAGLIVSWGRFSYGAPKVIYHEGDAGRLTVGSYCAFAMDVEIFLGGEHRTDWVSAYPFRAVFGLTGAFADGHPASRGDVVIGNDAWIGRGAKIRSGVTIGDGAVIGSYALVTRDVAPYSIVAGNPARELRRRFRPEDIERLLETRWWEWPHEEVLATVHLLNNPDLGGLLHYAQLRSANSSSSA